MLTFKRKLILNKRQSDRLDSWMGCVRLVYNLGLEIRREAWKNQQKHIHRFELNSQIKTIRDIDWLADAPAECLEEALKRMDLAYRKFFNGGGFPKFRSKKNSNSVSFRQHCFIEKNKLKVPKTDLIKMVNDSPVYGKIKKVTIRKQSGSYYACITTDANKNIRNQDDSQILGLDAGLAKFMTGSDGSVIENPRHFYNYERRLRIENRSLSRKKKGGKNWAKQASKLNRLHSKIANVRKDFLHKESTKIAKRANIVVVENLNVAGMSKNKNLSKSILDAGWGMFRNMLSYKTEVVTIQAAFTSQKCYDCGAVDKNSRINQAEFICTSCGIATNADYNAALNILSLGKAAIAKRKAIA